MMKLLRRKRSDGGAEHQEAVKSRVRSLTSVQHDFTGLRPEDVRRRLKGGRSEAAESTTAP